MSGDIVGSATICGTTTKTVRLPNGVSIFRAELYAITMAFNIIYCRKENNFIIFSDSMSSLQAVKSFRLELDLVYQIIKEYYHLTESGKRKNVTQKRFFYIYAIRHFVGLWCDSGYSWIFQLAELCRVQIAQTSHAKYGELENLYPAAVSSCIRCHTEGWRTGGRSTCTASWKSTQYPAVSALTPWLNWRRLETPSTLGRCMVYQHDVVSGVATSAKRAAAMPQQPHVLSQCPALAQCS